MSKTRQKKSSAGKNIAVFFIVFIILEGLIIFGFKSLFKTEESVPSFAGYSFFLMDSGNMSPTIPKDTLVIAVNGTPSADKISSAVLCKNVGDEGTTVGWLTEIGSKGDTVDGVKYTIYQDNVTGQDSIDNVRYYDIDSQDVIGVATSRYDVAGKMISFAITPFGMAICLAVPLVLLIVLEMIIAASNRSKYEDYDDGYEDDRQEENNNVALDDFLYGGNGTDVYGNTKPKADYSEEFNSAGAETQRPANSGKRSKKKRAAKPDFDVNKPILEEEANVFGDEEATVFAEETYDESDSEVTIRAEDLNNDIFGADQLQNEVSEQEFDDDDEVTSREEELSEEDRLHRMYYEKASRMIEGDEYQPADDPFAAADKAEAARQEAVSEEPVKLDKPAKTSAPAKEQTQTRQKSANPAQNRTSSRSAVHRAPQGSSSGSGVKRRRPSQSGSGTRQGSSQGRRPRPTQSRPAQRKTPHKDANAALEELMKKMSEEQEKLGAENNSEN